MYTYFIPRPSVSLGVLRLGRGLDSVGWTKSVRGNWPLWSPVVSLGLPCSPCITSGIQWYAVLVV